MNITLVGLNHQTAPVEVREKLALDQHEPDKVYSALKKAAPGCETIFFSTCNRVELVFASNSGNSDETVEQAKDFLSELNQIDRAEFEKHLYIYNTTEAIVHLFRVASSLDSMIVGEPQILGQIKDSFRDAVDNNSSGVTLNRLMHKAFTVAKRVRTETGIASHAVSISFAAVELARKIFGDLRGKKILLVGAGEMAELAAENLLAQRASEIVVANRTLSRALDLAKKFNGQAASLEELPSLLTDVDIVVSSTGAPDVVITAEMVKAVQKPRKHKPLFFVDIAVPRDIEPSVNKIPNVYLYDIDDLSHVVEENRAARADEAVRAGRIVQEEALKFQSWLLTLAVSPTIIDLKNKAEEIRNAELEKTLSKMKDLTEEQKQALEVMTGSLVQKIIHDPIQFIKHAGHRSNKDLYIELSRKLFNLDNDFESILKEENEPEED